MILSNLSDNELLSALQHSDNEEVKELHSRFATAQEAKQRAVDFLSNQISQLESDNDFLEQFIIKLEKETSILEEKISTLEEKIKESK